jgi:hypothetical protein
MVPRPSGASLDLGGVDGGSWESLWSVDAIGLEGCYNLLKMLVLGGSQAAIEMLGAIRSLCWLAVSFCLGLCLRNLSTCSRQCQLFIF